METDPRQSEPDTCSLESRDNPFLPGGELSRETEDLLSRATIVRDNFYLNGTKKQAVQEHPYPHSQLPGIKHIHIQDNPWDHVHCSSTGSYSPIQPASNVIPEERLQVGSSASHLFTSASDSSANGDNNNAIITRENGKVGDGSMATDNVRFSIPDEDSMSANDQTGNVGGADQVLLNPNVRDADTKQSNKCCSMM